MCVEKRTGSLISPRLAIACLTVLYVNNARYAYVLEIYVIVNRCDVINQLCDSAIENLIIFIGQFKIHVEGAFVNQGKKRIITTIIIIA